MAEAAVFKSGNSQAVRLPKPFRFRGKSVEIFRRGNEVVLREKRRTLAEVLADLPPLDPVDARALEQALATARTEPPQSRDWDRLLDTPPVAP